VSHLARSFPFVSFHQLDTRRRTHKAVVNSLEWSRDGHLLATAGGDGLVRLFDIRTFKELEPLRGHGKEVTCESTVQLNMSNRLGERFVERFLPRDPRPQPSLGTPFIAAC
jgi:WD40 repeat protein